MNVRNLTILGPQGSGKTTQAGMLARRFGFALIGAGDALREISLQDSELGKQIRHTINVEGRLVQPELISEVIKEKVATLPADQGLILDGYPRNLTQYALFRKFWRETGRGDYQVVFLEVSPEEAVKRLISRVACENCGAVFVEGAMETCARCGGRLAKRPDDTPEAIQTRLQVFYSETMPMIQAMEADLKVLHVDGDGSIDEVHQKIVANLHQH